MDEDEKQEHKLTVIIECKPEAHIEKSTSTTFEVLPARNDSTMLTDEDWEQVMGHKYGTYPNPFSPTTTLRFKVSAQDTVCIQLYDSKKMFVAELFEGLLSAGTYSLKITLPKQSDIPTGVYFCKVEIGAEKKLIKQLVLLE